MDSEPLRPPRIAVVAATYGVGGGASRAGCTPRWLCTPATAQREGCGTGG